MSNAETDRHDIAEAQVAQEVDLFRVGLVVRFVGLGFVVVGVVAAVVVVREVAQLLCLRRLEITRYQDLNRKVFMTKRDKSILLNTWA